MIDRKVYSISKYSASPFIRHYLLFLLGGALSHPLPERFSVLLGQFAAPLPLPPLPSRLPPETAATRFCHRYHLFWYIDILRFTCIESIQMKRIVKFSAIAIFERDYLLHLLWSSLSRVRCNSLRRVRIAPD